MPKRSNQFQRLVALIQRALVPLGAIVTESAMVPGDGPNDFREIDVLVQQPGPSGLVRIAVEAKDEKRKLDVQKVESYIGKYRSKSGIQVEHVILVARRGFTKQAVSRAEKENIETITLQKALNVNWSAKIPSRLVFNAPPRVRAYKFVPDLSLTPFDWALIHEGHVHCRSCNKDHGTPFDYGIRALTDSSTIAKLKEEGRRLGKEATVEGRFGFPPGHDIVLRYRGIDYPFRELHVLLSYVNAEGKVARTDYSYGDRSVQHMSGEIGGANVEFVVLDGNTQGTIPGRLNHAAATLSAEPAHKIPHIKFLGLHANHRAVVDSVVSAIGSDLLVVEIPGKLRTSPNDVEIAVDCVVRYKHFRVPIVVLSHEWASDIENENFIRDIHAVMSSSAIVATVVAANHLPSEAVIRQARDYGIHVTTPSSAAESNWLRLLVPRVNAYVTGVFFEEVVFETTLPAFDGILDRTAEISLGEHRRRVDEVLDALEEGLKEHFHDLTSLNVSGRDTAIPYVVEFVSALPDGSSLRQSTGATPVTVVRGRAKVKVWTRSLQELEAANVLASGNVAISHLKESPPELIENVVDLNVFRQRNSPITDNAGSSIHVRECEKHTGHWQLRVTWYPSRLSDRH